MPDDKWVPSKAGYPLGAETTHSLETFRFLVPRDHLRLAQHGVAEHTCVVKCILAFGLSARMNNDIILRTDRRPVWKGGTQARGVKGKPTSVWQLHHGPASTRTSESKDEDWELTHTRRR